ncbi:hypothetical protein [Lysinibacillus sp. JNUCC-52]|uniref:hypothetical protein n=1 Tax=Lysinibacillus sp. JNUCC-52 TaxID=2792480 RepID=UPI001937DB59|nr:hypothetical protein JNUCC52_17745 [Lysinibacillus sp. JNUCC-52]
MQKLTLLQTNLSDLASLSLGRKIRYIREFLQNEYGNVFSGKSVANRIQLISPSTLIQIEKDRAKDVYFGVVEAIAKDFGANLELFTNDFYKTKLPDSVDLIPLPVNDLIQEQNESENESILNGINPLLENSHHIKIQVSRQSSNMAEQPVVIVKSKEKYSKKEIFVVLSTIFNQVRTLDVALNPELDDLISSNNAIILSKEFINHMNNLSLDFPWYEKQQKIELDNQSYNLAQKYTEQLIKNHDAVKEKRKEK